MLKKAVLRFGDRMCVDGISQCDVTPAKIVDGMDDKRADREGAIDK